MGFFATTAAAILIAPLLSGSGYNSADTEGTWRSDSLVEIQPETQAAGVRSEDFAPFYRAQPKTAWCWAACIEMVLDHADVDVNQRAIVTQVYGADWTGEPPNNPGSFQQVTALLNQWGVDDDGDAFTVYAQFGQGAPVPAWLLGELRQNKPIIVLYHPNGPQIGHFVVITGAYYHDTWAGPQVTGLVIWDPFPYRRAYTQPPSYYTANRPMTGRFEVPADVLMSMTSFHWFIRATDESEFEWPEYEDD